MASVGRRRAAGQTAAFLCDEVPVTLSVVITNAGKQAQLEILLTSSIVDDPAPASRKLVKAGAGIWLRLKKRVGERVRLRDEGTKTRKVDRGGCIESDADLEIGIALAVSVGIVQSFDGMPNLLSVEKIHQQRER